MEVDINRLIGLGLSIEEYMILYLLHNDNRDILDSYNNNIGFGEDRDLSDILDNLYDKGYINNDENGESICTDKFKTEVLKIPKVDNNISFEEAFEQLREHFPTKVTSPNGAVRRLQSDIDRCKKLYKKTIVFSDGTIDLESHKFILQCIDFEVNERRKGKNEAYWQLLPTYLNQRGWELVEDDVEKLLKDKGTIINTSEDYIEDRL